MSWLSEKVKPDSPAVTGVEGAPRVVALLNLIVAVPVFIGLYWLVWHLRPLLQTWGVALAIVGIPVYCFLSYFFEPDPDDYENPIIDRPGETSRNEVIALLILT